jgi:hypothetical protein
MKGMFGENAYDQWKLDTLERESEGPTKEELINEEIDKFCDLLDDYSEVDVDFDNEIIVISCRCSGNPDFWCDTDLAGVIDDIKDRLPQFEYLGEDYKMDSETYHEAWFKIPGPKTQNL